MSSAVKGEKKTPGTKDKKVKKVDSPDISQSPSNLENEEPGYKVIDGSDIQALAIKEEDLQKLREKKLETPPVSQESLLVKKKNKNYYPTEEVYVAKLVPNKPLKPIDINGHTGLHFDKYGDCVPYSILGTIEDYLIEVKSQGKEIDMPYDPSDLADQPSTGIYDNKPTSKASTLGKDMSTKALINWQNKMIERKKTQGHISKLVKRSPDQLVMNQADNARRFNEIKTLIDRTLPLVQYGKGRRFDSEFWNQSLMLGQPEDGIFTTLTKSEKGELPPFEFIGKPNTILEELDQHNFKPSTVHYPWDKSKYLQQRLQELDPLIKEVASHRPELSQLEIVGNKRKRPDSRALKQDEDTWVNPDILYKSSVIEDTGFLKDEEIKDRLDDLPDVVNEPIFGPAIIFGGQLARWTGNDGENSGIIALESRLNFETKAGKRVSATFEIVNTGTTSIYFDWRKIPDSNPFDMVNSRVQRFYFDTRSNVILPGDILKINFVFKSAKGGVFTEKWEFITQPKLLSGASLILTLRGIAVQEDKFRKDRAFIEQNLLDREAEMIAHDMLEVILSGVRTPERPASPEDAYLTDEQTFSMLNPSLFYDHDTVEFLKTLYGALYPEEERIYNRWNLSIDSFKEEIMDLPENDERKQELLQKLNTSIYSLTFSSVNPSESKMYNICYNMLCQTIDDAVSEINTLKGSLRIQPTATEDVFPVFDKFTQEYEEWKKEFEVFKQLETERKNRLEKEKGKGKDKKGGAADKKDDKKKDDKKKPASTPVTAKGKQLSKSPPRSVAEKIEDRSVSFTPVSDEQKQLKKLYMEKIYFNVYHLLVRHFDNMDTIFQQLNQNEDINEKLSKMMSQPTYITPKNSDYID